MTTPVASTSDPQQGDLNAKIFQRLHPRIYLERFIAESVRPDGRTFDDWRDLSVNVGSIGTANGSSLVRLGDTTIVCGVKAEIAEPDLDRPDEGWIVPNIDLPPICSPKFKPGPPSDEAQALSDRLFDSLTSSNVLPLSSLCIEPGKSAWVLYVDATCINYDGNVFDAALVAMVSALKNTLLPKATFDPDTERTTCSRKKELMSPLELSEGLPISLSFGLFDSNILADPTSFEEPLLDTTISITLNTSTKQLLAVSQLGEGLAGSDVVGKCIQEAKRRLEDGSSIYEF
ncbi:uncharacterized protein STEHIDRAFT_171488 [Stereum hirsutum FP-91666 SS1]|uniref:uncharacterized protein n=1 Tax=Stereum hirsutum (strain FP-91666) TaxID=721885 RepID=UPI000444A83B|nr:uncharacterized protein STEHIDRAFT_171488 [Stereum hirsutum FP-91666 SS1]EIM81838.1 hypothetical protein STEHIDRAFT_171488 [Stereum hirsutum FP-91666 SS1]